MSGEAAAAERCPSPRPVRCLSVVVPLDRSGVVPGAIRIRAARIRSRRPTRAPVIGLTGGPGQAGVYFITDYAFLLPTPGRDLVLLDQRGTGASGLLRCPSIERDFKTSTFERAAAACGQRLGARRSYYTSADSAADVEALRIRLGVPQIALYAISYGTRVATEYARRYPDRVERMILDSAIGNDAPDGLARETLEAVARVLRSVCRIGCGGAHAHPVSDLRQLVKRLRSAPIRRTVRGRRVRVGADDLLGLLVSSDVNTAFMRRIPPAVRSAVGGNAAPLVRLKARFGGEDNDRPSEFSSAVYAATTCEESSFPWDPAAPRLTRRMQARAAADATPDAAFEPFDRAAALRFGLLPLCGSWPARERVVAPSPPLPTTVPTLVLAGELDLRTPLENARRLTQALGGRLVVERGVGHQVLGADPNGCAMPAVEAFLAGRGVPECRRDASISIGRAVSRRAPSVDPG